MNFDNIFIYLNCIQRCKYKFISSCLQCGNTEGFFYCFIESAIITLRNKTQFAQVKAIPP